MTTEKGPRSANSEGQHDDGTKVPPLDSTHPPCRNRGDCWDNRVKARCWDDDGTPGAVAARLDAEDREVARRMRLASLDLADGGRWVEPWARSRQAAQRRARLLEPRPETRRDPADCLASWGLD